MVVIAEILIGGLFGWLVGVGAKKLEHWWYNR